MSTIATSRTLRDMSLITLKTPSSGQFRHIRPPSRLPSSIRLGSTRPNLRIACNATPEDHTTTGDAASSSSAAAMDQLLHLQQQQQSSPLRSFARNALVSGALLAAIVRPPTAGASPAAQPTGQAATAASTSWRDTGIQLAAADGENKNSAKSVYMTPEELDAETRSALSRYANERQQKQLKRATRTSRKVVLIGLQ